jgi:DUF4097 and DUF4098 domain-containing protein YvlB
LLVLAAVLATCLAGCMALTTAISRFDRNLTVNGPVRLELSNGSGETHIRAGAPGEVRIHGEFRVHAWPWESAQHRVANIVQNPPIEQQNNLIRVGGFRHTNMEVNYTITVPPETEVRGVIGSGDIDVRGIHGPLNLTAGSGNISADGIAENVQAVAGSGNIRLSNLRGPVQAATGSGNLELIAIGGEIRAHTGSGNITITRPEGNVTLGAGSGNISVSNASGDLRARTSSGDLVIDGNPGAHSYWEFHTSSGSVELHVPADAGFRLHARSSSGGIETSIPIIIEERTSPHELRARVGQGQARVEVETSSGGIHLH